MNYILVGSDSSLQMRRRNKLFHGKRLWPPSYGVIRRWRQNWSAKFLQYTSGKYQIFAPLWLIYDKRYCWRIAGECSLFQKLKILLSAVMTCITPHKLTNEKVLFSLQTLVDYILNCCNVNFLVLESICSAVYLSAVNQYKQYYTALK